MDTQPLIFEATLTIIGAVFSLVVIPLIRTLGKHAAAWLEAKTHMASFACATEKLSVLVADAVLDMEQSFVAKMKLQGKWDDTTKKLAKDAAIEGVSRSLGGKGVEEVMGCLGLSESELAQRVSQMVESFIAARKAPTATPTIS